MLGTRLIAAEGRTAALGGAIATVPMVALVLSNEQSLAQLVPVVGLMSYALVLGAAVLTYFRWRLTWDRGADAVDRRLTAWLTVGLTVGAVNGFLQLTSSSPGELLSPVAAQLVLTLLLCLMAAVSERVDVPGDPAVASAATAAVITATYSIAVWLAPTVVLTGTTTALLNTAILLAGLLLALIVLNRTKVSLWARRRVAAAAVLLTCAQCASNLDSTREVLMGVAIVGFVLGALTLCLMTYQMLRSSLQQQQAEVDRLQRSLADVRSAVLEDRELLHEVGATLAGITSASQVMRTGQGVPAHRRQRLETMLTAELARLERLMAHRVCGEEQPEDQHMWVDEVVQPVVVSHQERQRTVVWIPSGQEAYGDPDALAEVCNILLENAARHARGAAVRLSVTVRDDDVVVTCSDDGPGVPLEMRERIFDAEAKGARSQGQGLGLAIAQRLASARGGSLDLADLARPGATFVARMPRRVGADVPAGHVA
jgi:signal transduction histidine kinase